MVNPMITKSIRLATDPGYIDKLSAIYNVSSVERRNYPKQTLDEIVELHKAKNDKELVAKLLELEKFPFDDINTGFLREYPDALSTNPKTVARIAKRLYQCDKDELLNLILQPKVDNRRMGELFHNWLHSRDYQKVPWDTFKQMDSVQDLEGNQRKVLMLDGSRSDWKRFANNELGCGFEKEPDILLKVSGQYIVGEAKYFGNYGGNQDRQFDDAESILLSTQGNATRIALLDGVVWLDTGNRMCEKIRRSNGLAMSALLFEQFIAELQVQVIPTRRGTHRRHS